jgi:hypothetical protein
MWRPQGSAKDSQSNRWCIAQQLEFARIRVLQASIERFTVLSGRLVPASGDEG